MITEDKRNSVALGTLGDRGSWKGQCVGSAWYKQAGLSALPEASRGGEGQEGPCQAETLKPVWAEHTGAPDTDVSSHTWVFQTCDSFSNS